jgi:hypothetical protein
MGINPGAISGQFRGIQSYTSCKLSTHCTWLQRRAVSRDHGLRFASIDVKVDNLAFGVTPVKYVTGIVTENGIAYPPFEINLRKIVRCTQFERKRTRPQIEVRPVVFLLIHAGDFVLGHTRADFKQIASPL